MKSAVTLATVATEFLERPGLAPSTRETEDIPIEGVLRSGWQEIILEKNADGEIKVNRINYELSVLQALRDQLRCKEIWVVGANRYRNPEEDLPADFEGQRLEYFQALKQPSDVEVFIVDLQQALDEALALNEHGKIFSDVNALYSISIRYMVWHDFHRHNFPSVLIVPAKSWRRDAKIFYDKFKKLKLLNKINQDILVKILRSLSFPPLPEYTVSGMGGIF